MHNSKLDFNEIFSLKSQRKNKSKSQGIKYLDRPFTQIKPVRHIIFNNSCSRFALITDKHLWMFDNFSKQNTFFISVEQLEFTKLIFFKEDIVAINASGLYYMRDEGHNSKFKLHYSKADLEDSGFEDVENIEDKGVALVGEKNCSYISFFVSEGGARGIHPEVTYTCDWGAKKVKYLRFLEHRAVSVFLDFTNPAHLRYLYVGKNFELVGQTEIVPSCDKPGLAEKREEGEAPAEDRMEEEELQPKALSTIDSVIHIPHTEQVIVVDLLNGLFIAQPEKDGSASLKPFFDLEQYDKIKLRCACLCADHSRAPLLCMFSMRQSHQHIHFIPVNSHDREQFSEISESKIKAKKVHFNKLWNSFMIIDYDDNYYLMEFYNLNYYEKYWIRFKAIDENQYYVEEENEFDKQKERPLSENEIFEMINGRG